MTDQAAPAAPATPAPEAAPAMPEPLLTGAQAAETTPAPEATQDAEAKAPEQGEEQSPDTPPKDAEGESTDQQPAAEFKLETPEGAEAYEGDIADFNEAATEYLKANPEATAADGLKWAAERQAKLVMEAAAGMEQEVIQRHAKVVKEWDDAARTDAEYGGADFDDNIAIANKALVELGTPALGALLEETGMSNHPEVVRFNYRVGKLIKDATVVKGDTAAGRKPTFTESLGYGT